MIVPLAVAVRGDGPPPVTDKTVEAAINRGVGWLKGKRNEWGHWETANASTGDRYWAGNSALVTLALLYAGEDPRGDDLAKALDWLAGQPITTTYVYGIRAHVFSLVGGTKHRKRLDSDLEWLIKAIYPAKSESRGAYDYESKASASDSAGSRYDNSNSQFGVLGVWMATEAGQTSAELDAYWKLVEEHWLRDQNADGGWSYERNQPSSGSMTVAGLATMYVLLDRIHARTGMRNAKPDIAAIDAGLNWLSREFTPLNPHGAGWKYYYLYGVERAARASGRKYFRELDWFREGAQELLKNQQADGSWPGEGNTNDLHNTCFALMFLCHGRAPLLFNKLEKGEDWNQYLRDVPSLNRYANHTFEKMLNWQIVSLDGSIEDLLEAPVLYMHGTRTWEFSDAELARLREYSERGGVLLAVCPKDAKDFRASMTKLSHDLFPDLKLRRMSRKDPLFSGQLQFVIDDPPEVLEVHNGLRPLMLLVADDIAGAWNRYDTKKAEPAFQLACNIYLYATDKTSIPSRLVTNTIPLEPVATARTIRVARIQYRGNWNTEPYGWQRLRTYMNNTAKTRLDVRAGVHLDSKDLDEFKIAHITGTTAFSLSQAELAGLRRFLTDGGTLLADAACGSREFAESLERNVAEALRIEPARLPNDSSILTAAGLADGVRLNHVEYRRTARGEARGREYPLLKAYMLGQRPAVIYSPLDLSVGLLGTRVYDCRGYDGESCLSIMRNLLLYGALSTSDKLKLGGNGR